MTLQDYLGKEFEDEKALKTNLTLEFFFFSVVWDVFQRKL